MSDDNMPTHYLNLGAHNYTRYPLTPFISILKFTQNITWCPSTSLHIFTVYISTAMPLSNHPVSINILQVTAGALPPLPSWPRTCWCPWRPAPLSRRAAGVAATLAAESGRRPAGPRRWAATRTLGSGVGSWEFIPCFSNVITCYPPTPALAKAGAAPGTTAGVELLLLSFPRSNLSRSQQRCPKATSRKHSPGMLHPSAKTSRHLDMKITCFGQVSFPADGFVFQGQSSRSRIPVVAVQVLDLMKTAGTVLCLPCGHQTREAVRRAFAANRHPKATSMASYGRPSLPLGHINGFLWESKLAVCQPLNP